MELGLLDVVVVVGGELMKTEGVTVDGIKVVGL
jgi:hypothetical protein